MSNGSAPGFFDQFLLQPDKALAQEDKEAITKLISAFVRAYDAIAADRGVDPLTMSFRRPIYLAVATGIDGYFVLYTNENAVRGHSGWYHMRANDQAAHRQTIDVMISAIRRHLGLDGWKGFFLSHELVASLDQADIPPDLLAGAHRVFERDFEEELMRQRLVQINPVFTGRGFAVEPDLCFVLMPFREELRPVYDDHIRKTVEELGLRCQRSDDIFRHTAIIEDIWESINKARLIIADLTGKNPNVFYEVGVAHTVGKDVVLVTQLIDDVPFDLRHLRHIQYEYTPRGMEVFEQQLCNTVATITGRTSSIG